MFPFYVKLYYFSVKCLMKLAFYQVSICLSTGNQKNQVSTLIAKTRAMYKWTSF